MQGGQGALAQRTAQERVAKGPDQHAGTHAQQDQRQRRGLQHREVLRDGGLQGEPAEPRDIEDLLHGDRAADQTDDGRQQLGQHAGQGTAQRVAGDVAGREPHGVRRARPRFAEGRGQRLIEQTAEHRARRDAEGQ